MFNIKNSQIIPIRFVRRPTTGFAAITTTITTATLGEPGYIAPMVFAIIAILLLPIAILSFSLGKLNEALNVAVTSDDET